MIAKLYKGRGRDACEELLARGIAYMIKRLLNALFLIFGNFAIFNHS
jgi:hypothetical protein